jgi:hypothetical protein
MKKILFIIFILFSFCFISCDKSDSVSNVVVPGDNDPYIIDAALCVRIENNLPYGITNYFILGKDVYLWVHWANVTKDQKVIVEWRNPDDNKEAESSVTFQSTTNKQVTLHKLNLSAFAKTGEWQVKIYLNNSFMRSYYFNVGEN